MNATVNTTVALPGYRLVEPLYCGSRTVVYRGVRLVDDQAVVVKILQQDYPTFYDLLQFRNQYAIAKNLNFPGIVRPYSLESYRNGYALVLEDFGGVSLRDYVGNQALAIPEVLSIALQLTDILHNLHACRVIHKDIKPANLLIHPETKQIQLIDFSIASLLPRETQEIQNPNFLEGTLAYISPEQTGRMNRGIDYRSDFYSLGVTFYQLLAGQLPFASNEPIELIHAHIAKTPPSVYDLNPEIPPIVSDLIGKLMAKNAEERYQSALGLKYDLEQCLNQWRETGKIAQFQLGERDLCDRFLIPEKLYGRETEVKTLLEAFERVSNGASELMLVAGFSGIGKTVVINEVHKPIVRQRGYFIKGKFDQFNRNIPFSAFVQAFRDLMGKLLSESDAQLATWKAKIIGALGENGQVIIDVMPELELIIGQQPPVAELSGNAAQNRFHLLFQKFIQVFTTKDHPLVMFLDDLQWADSASLNLLKLLMSEASSGYLLILGAYRDNEVFPAHPLMLTLEAIKKAAAAINTITLAPLHRADINQLVADTLHCSTELSQPLADLIYQKTKGNPFFATQFLKALYSDRMITFNFQEHYWESDLAQVKASALTDDVVEFMAAQLQKLPAQTQEILKLAACIGNSFDLTTLAIVSEKSPVDTAVDLWKALQSGLILPISETYKFFQSGDTVSTPEISVPYRFLHDRVQQAAYSLIPGDQKEATHLKMGRLLLKVNSQNEQEERLFDIVGHLNLGFDLMNGTEKTELARLNLAAGQKANISTAYTAGAEYAFMGIKLLNADCWKNQYPLTLALYETAAEATYLSGDFEQMDRLTDAILQRDNPLLDQIKSYELKIQKLQSQNQLLNAVKMALHVLELLGVKFSLEPDSSEINQAFEETLLILDNRDPLSLIDLPKMTEPYQLAMMRILSTMFASTYLSSPQLLPRIILKQVNLSLEYGNASESASAYAKYGLLLCAIANNIELGYKFSELALGLLENSNAKASKAQTINVACAGVLFWKKPLSQATKRLVEGYQSGLESGDIEFASHCVMNYLSYSFYYGKELSELEQEMSTYSAAIAKLKQKSRLQNINSFRQTVLNLASRVEHPECLEGESFNESVELPLLNESKDRTALAFIYTQKLMLSYLFGEIVKARKIAAIAQQYLDAVPGMIWVAIFYWYDALTQLAVCSELTDGKQKEKLLFHVLENQAKMRHWAECAPANFCHKYELVEAQRHQIFGNKTEAIEFYDRAIKGAKANGYIQEEALANELAAKFYLDWGKEKVAAGYMQEAYYCYAKWGSNAKTLDLEKRYPQLLTPILQSEKLRQEPGQTITQFSTEIIHGNSTGSTSVLDLAAVIKASQILSREIELEQLLSTLMRVVMENAGADRGALMLLNDQQWQVVVSCKDTQPCTLESTPLDESPFVPLSIINRVKHTQEVLVLHTARSQSALAADPYLISQRPQSLLCSPLLNQGKLVGIVYLENNLATGAFSRDRIELLNLICSQAAISLENARLYQQLEDYSHTLEVKVAERTAQLQAAQKQMVAQEKLASLGTLTAGIAHELRNPLNFVNNYAELCVELSQELLQELENPTQDSNYIPELLIDLKDNAAAIHRHGQRADNIIRSMMEHAKSGTDLAQRQTTDLNQLLAEAVQLVYHSQRAAAPDFNITLNANYDDSIGKLEVMPNALSRALINLLDNACYAVCAKQKKADPNFTPKIEITTKNQDNWIEICFRDNGTGITSEIQQKIFEPFFTTKPTGDGTGLGLSLTHDIIVEQHRGTLKVESELESYTEFRITLPKFAS